MSLADYSPGYTNLWDTMTVRSDRAPTVSSIANRLYGNKDRYLRVSNATGVPWFVIAAIHERESSGDFKTQLAQGDPLNSVSTDVPRGKGPYTGPDAWEKAAIFALQYDRLDKVTRWDEDSCCYELETYNGFGPRHHGINSGYLWSFTNHYEQGKYVADGGWNPTFVDQQCGAIPLVKTLMQMDQATWPEPLPTVPVVPKNVTGAGAGAAAGTAAASAGLEWYWVIGIAIVVGLVAWFAIHYSQK